MRAVLRVDPPLFRDVFEELLKQSGIEVVASPPDFLALLVEIKQRQPEVVFLSVPDAAAPPAACALLLNEFPQLKIVAVSRDKYAVADIGVRMLYSDDLSVESIHASLLNVLSD